jgi:hypothetical protein
MMAKRRKKPREFYVLLTCHGNSVSDINWKCHGKTGVGMDREKRKSDEILLVREVIRSRGRRRE